MNEIPFYWHLHLTHREPFDNGTARDTLDAAAEYYALGCYVCRQWDGAAQNARTATQEHAERN